MRLAACSLLVALAAPAALPAQEVKYIDLVEVSQRTTLRYPAAPPAKCDGNNPCSVPGGSIGGSVADGGPDVRDPRALAVVLECVDPIEINPAQPFEAEFKVVNTGLVPISIPTSPHLADMQSSDTEPFDYDSISLVVHVTGVPNGHDVVSVAYVQLYGAADHEGTLLVLKPGQWIRVRAKLQLRQWPLEPVDARFRGEFWLRKNTFRPRAGGYVTNIRNVYPNVTPTPWTTVHLLRPDKTQSQKQRPCDDNSECARCR